MKTKATIHNVKFSDFDFMDIDVKNEDNFKYLRHSSMIEVDYTYKKERKNILIVMKQGFKSDGSSVPSFAHCIIRPWYDDDKKNIGALVHDCAYVFGGDNIDKTMLEFDEANAIFHAILTYFEVESSWKLGLAYRAVSSFIGKRCYSTTNRFDKYNYDFVDWHWGKQ